MIRIAGQAPIVYLREENLMVDGVKLGVVIKNLENPESNE